MTEFQMPASIEVMGELEALLKAKTSSEQEYQQAIYTPVLNMVDIMLNLPEIRRVTQKHLANMQNVSVFFPTTGRIGGEDVPLAVMLMLAADNSVAVFLGLEDEATEMLTLVRNHMKAAIVTIEANRTFTVIENEG